MRNTWRAYCSGDGVELELSLVAGLERVRYKGINSYYVRLCDLNMYTYINVKMFYTLSYFIFVKVLYAAIV